jgi:hypothetical protein
MRFRTITLLFALGTAVLPTGVIGQVHRLIERSHVDGSGIAFTPDGTLRVDLREVQTVTEGAKGPIELSVLVIRDPNSGTYSWRARTASPVDPSWRMKQFNDTQVLFLKDDEFTDFMALAAPLRLFAHQYSGHASSMNEAVDRSLTDASASPHSFEDVEATRGVHVIQLSAVGIDFTSNPTSVTIDVMPTVTNVQWNGKHWTVTLKARWTEEIILNSDFKVISMRRVGS